MLPARCNLQRAGRMVFYVCVSAIAFMFIYTQHESEIAGNSVALLVEIQRKLKYVQLGAACGPQQSMNQSSQFTHSTFRAACGLRPAAKYEPAFSVLTCA